MATSISKLGFMTDSASRSIIFVLALVTPCFFPYFSHLFFITFKLLMQSLEHGFFFFLLFLLPVHHCHDNVPLLLGQVAQVGQLLHGGRHRGWARTAGPRGRGHFRGLPAPSSGSRALTFRIHAQQLRPCLPLTAEPSGRRRQEEEQRQQQSRGLSEPSLSWLFASTQPRMLPLFWSP